MLKDSETAQIFRSQAAEYVEVPWLLGAAASDIVVERFYSEVKS